MSAPVLPAPLWRRLLAAVYDGLLLIGLWLLALILEVIVRDQLLGLERHWLALRVYLFVIGLWFFGWFWIHGGQTLGMRVWRLQVRRDDGAALRWPIALLRYAAAYLSWGLAGLGMLWCLIDARRRAFHDLLAGTEVVVLPKSAAP